MKCEKCGQECLTQIECELRQENKKLKDRLVEVWWEGWEYGICVYDENNWYYPEYEVCPYEVEDES